MALTVEPVDPPQIQAWQVTPATANDVMMALATVATVGYAGNVSTYVQPNSTDVIWTVKLSRTGSATLVAYDTEWIVFDGQHVLVLSNADLIDRYTADVPLAWDATAPQATALPSDQVSLTFAQPTSANGPFVYAVEASDTTANTSAPLTIIDQSVTNGVVTLKGGGLITGHGYLFTVTVTSKNGGTDTSQPSLSITAIL